MKALAVFVLALLSLLACTPPRRVHGEPCERHVRQVYHVDTAFLPMQRAALVGGADDLLGFTAGRVHQTLLFDLDFESTSDVVTRSKEPMIVRIESWMMPVQMVDREVSAKRGRPTQVWAWTSTQLEVRIFVVIDRVPPESLRFIAAHELAHAAGFFWPNCDPAREECDHVTDPSSLMNAEYRGARSFSATDLAFCRASCLCP